MTDKSLKRLSNYRDSSLCTEQYTIGASPLSRAINPGFHMIVKPGFHMIVTVGDASPRQARGQIGDSCVKWEHFLNDVADVTDQTGVVRGRF